MSAKNLSRRNWAALGITLLALDGASLIGAHQAWVWLSNGEGAAMIKAGSVVAERAYDTAAGTVIDVASQLAIRAVKQTTSWYALMDSLTHGTKTSNVHSAECRVIRIQSLRLNHLARARTHSR